MRFKNTSFAAFAGGFKAIADRQTLNHRSPVASHLPFHKYPSGQTRSAGYAKTQQESLYTTHLQSPHSIRLKQKPGGKSEKEYEYGA